MIAGGALGVFLTYYTRPRFGLLHSLMAEGRIIRDSMGVGKINPCNSRVNEGRCRDWERAVHDAVSHHDAGSAESFMVGSPEIDDAAKWAGDRINWQMFMDGRLGQLDLIIRRLRS